ncbi:hypothetical protein ABZ953_00505 [Streptomyces sp. NPDC046465]|uniref:hypothetical protein n=1 Tax=Streptomyces sp. NPDC046465 TaxID=3155810 RepID=UPI0033EDBC2D
MARTRSRTGRRTGRRTGHGQLLLLAALLLGIVTMHTLGHPSGGHESGYEGGHGGGSAASAPMRHDMGAAPAAPHDAGPGAVLGPATDSGTTVTETAASAPEPHGAMSMDPLSVCLAVLGAFTLLVLLVLVRAGLLRPGGTLAHLPPPGRLRHAPRPEPPPLRILLARLSVLRI